MVWQVLYVSRPADPEQQSQIIQEILSVSQVNNSRDAITGVLLHQKGILLQFMEGPQDKVESCFERITKDPRHKNVTRIFGIRNRSRVFEGMPLADYEVTPQDIKKINETFAWNKLIHGAKTIESELILNMLRTLSHKIAASHMPQKAAG